MSFAMNCCVSSDIPLLRGPVPLSHLLIRQFIRSGDHVIDATCGNGHDTLMLAELVGARGKVWAFDIQRTAIDNTLARLAQAHWGENTELIHASHETITAHVNGPINGIMFNLGYLPSGDRSLVTRPESTLAGLEQSLKILAPGGIIAITIYSGHDGGACERSALEARLLHIPPNDFHVWRMGQMNVPGDAPYFILIQKTL
jgi:predicted methyltransferase